MQLMNLLYISWGVMALMAIVFTVFIAITAPVAMPYFKTKLMGGTLLAIKRMNGNFTFRRSGSNDSVLDCGAYGSFIPNPKSAARIAGVPGFVVYEQHAVPPTTEAIDAGVELQENNFPVHMDLRDTAEEAAKKGVLKEYQVDALFDYANAVNPHYVNARVERKIAESLRQMRTPIGTVLAYATIFMMVMLAAAVAYTMVSNGAGTGAVENIASTIAM